MNNQLKKNLMEDFNSEYSKQVNFNIIFNFWVKN